jgi:C1A family cysteine protease
MLRRYGLKFPIPDHRDLGVTRFLAYSPLVIPSSIDLEPWCGPKKDQGSLGACTAFAASEFMELLHRKHDEEYFGERAEFAPVLSPLFGYYKEREMDGTLVEGDTGSYGRTACKVLTKFGLCLETEDPYAPSDYQTPPTPEQLTEAATFRLGAYHAVSSVDDMRHCLASGYPIMAGFTVFMSFETKTGGSHLYAPKPGHEEVLGGHEVLFIGYDDAKFGGAFKVRNSWGPDWADSGNFWFAYPSAADPRIFSDGFTGHFGKPW